MAIHDIELDRIEFLIKCNVHVTLQSKPKWLNGCLNKYCISSEPTFDCTGLQEDVDANVIVGRNIKAHFSTHVDLNSSADKLSQFYP